MNYKQLQTELKALRERGLVDPNLKLNAPSQVLAKAYIECEGKQEREQVLNSPILVVWVAIACLSLLIGIVCLSLVLAVKLYGFVASRLVGKLKLNKKMLKSTKDLVMKPKTYLRMCKNILIRTSI